MCGMSLGEVVGSLLSVVLPSLANATNRDNWNISKIFKIQVFILNIWNIRRHLICIYFSISLFFCFILCELHYSHDNHHPYGRRLFSHPPQDNVRVLEIFVVFPFRQFLVSKMTRARYFIVSVSIKTFHDCRIITARHNIFFLVYNE